MILNILNIHIKKSPTKNPKHISISVLYYIISISCFVFLFAGFLKKNCPWGGVSARFFCPSGQGFAPFLRLGGMVRLGITDTLCINL